jgi:hypothetical protein
MPKGGPDFTARGKPRVKMTAGRPAWQPNDEQRMIVRFLSGRLTQESIASIVGTTVDTLAKRCRKELDEGADDANVMIEGALFRECMRGNVTAIIWWDKTRRRMKEVVAHEVGGVDGKPIEHDHKFSAKEAAERFKKELG